MRIATGQADGKIREHEVIGAEGYTSGGEIKATRITGVANVGELARPRQETSPAIPRCRLHHRRAALAFGSSRPSEAPAKVATINGNVEASAAGVAVLQLPLQTHGIPFSLC